MALFKGKLFKAGKLFAGKLFGFTLEIVVQPIGTGGGPLGAIPDLRDYRVTIRITRNSKIWERIFVTSQTGLASLESVIATFKGIKRFFDTITVHVSGPISINIKRIYILVKNRGKK